MKYTTVGGITLRATVDSIDNDNCNLSISLRDTGVGVSEDFKDVIFNSFDLIGYMEEGTPYEFGLGLTLSQMYAKLMNGIIEVDSPEGQGATFTFKFRQKIIDATAVGEFK